MNSLRDRPPRRDLTTDDLALLAEHQRRVVEVQAARDRAFVERDVADAAKPLPARGKGAQRTKCTPRRVARICRAVAEGRSFEEAAAVGGVAPATLRGWLGRPGPAYARFRLALAEAERQAGRPLTRAPSRRTVRRR